MGKLEKLDSRPEAKGFDSRWGNEPAQGWQPRFSEGGGAEPVPEITKDGLSSLLGQTALRNGVGRKTPSRNGGGNNGAGGNGSLSPEHLRRVIGHTSVKGVGQQGRERRIRSKQ